MYDELQFAACRKKLPVYLAELASACARSKPDGPFPRADGGVEAWCHCGGRDLEFCGFILGLKIRLRGLAGGHHLGAETGKTADAQDAAFRREQVGNREGVFRRKALAQDQSSAGKRRQLEA